MKIKWLGHACFSITTSAGTTVLTDPFDASVGYPVPACAADIVTESHQHHDHNDVSSLSLVGQILSKPCDVQIGAIHISTVSAFHDDEQGAKRGKNLIFIIEADGLKIVHAGDLGHMLSDEQIEAISGADVLMIPVGGFYTIDADTAEAIRRAASPKITIPMHFLTPAMSFPIADEKPFLALNGGVYAGSDEIELSAQSAGSHPAVIVLDYPAK